MIDGKQKQIVINTEINNEIRTFGATLSYFISRLVIVVYSKSVQLLLRKRSKLKYPDCGILPVFKKLTLCELVTMT